MKAIWNDQVLAESNDTKVVEGNHYFPPESLNSEFFQLSDTHTICPWKGQASYFHLIVGEAKNPVAAWYYHRPKDNARAIGDYVAFWKEVEIIE